MLVGGLLLANILPINNIFSFSIQIMQMIFVLFDDGNKLKETIEFTSEINKILLMRIKIKAILFFAITASTLLKFWFHASGYYF
jgi:hypothetical protein